MDCAVRANGTTGTSPDRGWRADPCLMLDCRALNLRRADQPRPRVCPRCGGPLLAPGRPLGGAAFEGEPARRSGGRRGGGSGGAGR